MATYELDSERRTLHGCFSRDIVPVLTIDPGDVVAFRTLCGGWGLHNQPTFTGETTKFSGRRPGLDSGHALCGPIAVRGAKPGMALEVRIRRIVPGTWGWSSTGSSELPILKRLKLTDRTRGKYRWRIDPQTSSAVSEKGRRVPIRPFMGVMGMAPDEPGILSTRPPRVCGGNIDCKELVEGSTVFLPIAVKGGLFSTGDGHAAQGDGEASGTAIECPMERVELEFHIHPTLRLSMPRAHTPIGWVVMGLHEDLEEASLAALEEIVVLMEELHGVDRYEALILAGVAVDLRITQIVNGVCGVHAVLPHGAIQKTD